MLPAPLPFPLAAAPWPDCDTSIAAWFHHRLTPTFTSILQGLSGPGSGPAVTFLVITLTLALAWKRRWTSLLTFLLIVPCGVLLGELVKLVVQRPRPFPVGPLGPWGGYSFPSGHTISATLLYGFLAISLASLLPSRRWRWFAGLLAVFLILGVGFSRIALGAHHLTDVLAAILLGLMWLTFCLWAARTIRRVRLRPAPVPLAPSIPPAAPPSHEPPPLA